MSELFYSEKQSMSVNQMSLRARSNSVSASNRLLGTLGMVAAPFLCLEFMLVGLTFDGTKTPNQFVGALELVYLGGWLASAAGLRRLRVTGAGAAGRVIFVIQLIGLTLAALFTIQGIVQTNPDTTSIFFKVTDAAWPLSHLFMLIVGAFVLKAGVWRGWRRFAPLLCGLALPALFAANAIFGSKVGGIVFGLGTTATFMALGYAVRTSEK
jgi:hypothetical protein